MDVDIKHTVIRVTKSCAENWRKRQMSRNAFDDWKVNILASSPFQRICAVFPFVIITSTQAKVPTIISYHSCFLSRTKSTWAYLLNQVSHTKNFTTPKRKPVLAGCLDEDLICKNRYIFFFIRFGKLHLAPPGEIAVLSQVKGGFKQCICTEWTCWKRVGFHLLPLV